MQRLGEACTDHGEDRTLHACVAHNPGECELEEGGFVRRRASRETEHGNGGAGVCWWNHPKRSALARPQPDTVEHLAPPKGLQRGDH